MVYSPLEATYGRRIERLLENSIDYRNYHAVLNCKLQKLKRRLNLTTKDTKKYLSKEKYSKVDENSYYKDRLFGVLVLLHAERDQAFVETLKLQARQRGKLKMSEKKLIRTRLKKVVASCSKLVSMMRNEENWGIKAQVMIYYKLSNVEYLVNGKQSKIKNSELIFKELCVIFLGLRYLNRLRIVSDEIAEYITSRFEWTLRQYSVGLKSQELQQFLAHQSQKYANDDLMELLLLNGFEFPSTDSVMDEDQLPKDISWRSYSAQIRCPKAAQQFYEAMHIQTTNLSSYSDKILKLQQVIDTHSQFMKQNEDVLEPHDEKDDQIFLTYLKYNHFLILIQRDDILFRKLYEQWNTASKLNKGAVCERIERIVHNLTTYLQEVMELPGVYSDDELMAHLELAKTYYHGYFTGRCLAPLYQSGGKYLEALALYNHSLKTLVSATTLVATETPDLQDLVSRDKANELIQLLRTSCKSVVALAEYANSIKAKSSKYDFSLVERINIKAPISYKNIDLENIFPTRPQVKPVWSKSTFFDMAYNYINYDVAFTPGEVKQKPEQEPITKKKGILALFSR